MTTAISFSGAGAKIVLEIGYAEALIELQAQKIVEPYSLLTGTSSGALMAAAFHAGQVPEFKQLLLNLTNSQVYSLNIFKIFGKEACIYDNAPLRKLLKGFLNCGAVRANTRPCLINCTNISTWKVDARDITKIQNDDDMIDFIVSSTSVPMAFPCRNNLVDGGLLMDYPIFSMINDSTEKLLLFVNSIIQPKPINNIKDMIDQVASVSLYNQLLMSLQALETGSYKTKVVLVQPDKPVDISLLDFSSMKKEDKIAWMEYSKALAFRKLIPAKNLVEDLGVRPAEAIKQLQAQAIRNLHV